MEERSTNTYILPGVGSTAGGPSGMRLMAIGFISFVTIVYLKVYLYLHGIVLDYLY